LVTPTVRIARTEADEHLQTTQPDIRSCFIRPVDQPAIPRPHLDRDQFLVSKMASTPWLTLDVCTCTFSLSAEVCNCTI
jgi:hypothetical protein